MMFPGSPRMISSAWCNLSLWALCLWSQSCKLQNAARSYGICRRIRQIASNCNSSVSLASYPFCGRDTACCSPYCTSSLVSFRSLFCEVTAFLGDGIIFILFLVQRKSVVYRTEWTEARKARQRCWWSFRRAEHVKTRLT